MPWIVDNGPTAKKDKLNDNLLWSCCCARVDWTWTPVCDCYSGSNQCDTNCLEDALIEDSLFYTVAIVCTCPFLHAPDSQLTASCRTYITILPICTLAPISGLQVSPISTYLKARIFKKSYSGHSLGGGIASLLGASFGVPVVAFESPGEKFAAQRLHLPSPVRSVKLV